MTSRTPIRNVSVQILLVLFLMPLLHAGQGAPNILFIVLDDLNADDVGVYGCPIPQTTPCIDQLAMEGMRFDNAFITSPNCSPSRNSLQTGRYPSTNGVRGFYNVKPNYRILPEELRKAGYFAACINKPRDTTVNTNYDDYWDWVDIFKGTPKRDPAHYAAKLSEVVEIARKAGKPFYAVVNIADPHYPIWGDKQSIKLGFDKVRPSRIFKVNEVKTPAYLVDDPEVRQEMAQYYTSVRKGDDCAGAVLSVLEEKRLSHNTLVILISDHGAPFPFAKSSLTNNGIKVPWIIRWPGVVKKGSVNDSHLISAIDFMPTLLDIAGVQADEGIEGESFLPLLKGEEMKSRRYIYAEYNENAGGHPFPSITIRGKRFGYIFNAWATGDYKFIVANNFKKPFKRMELLARTDPKARKRFDYYMNRTVEEFYDYDSDPHAFNNLIRNPEHSETIRSFRAELERWLKARSHYILPAFQHRQDVNHLKGFMQKQMEEAMFRATTYSWKRFKNIAGPGAMKRKELFSVGKPRLRCVDE